ncbi:hypothetical protein ABZ897_56115 [Nonomuraea sp. NPDC046802]|uniref:hypothetical protein n=1 Tax=Nonomuraea sp. NPDC046802 TaxID=3154919 RepID=UPI00340FD440
MLAGLDEIVRRPGVDTEHSLRPLRRLAGDVGQGGSVEQLIRLAEDAQTHGAAATSEEVVALLAAHRARDPRLWDGLRIATAYDMARPGDDEARALSRLAEITGAESRSRIWVFDPLRRLAGDAGLGHSVTTISWRTTPVC